MDKSFLLNGFNVTEQDVLSYKDDNIDLIDIDLDRISTLLLIQLTSAWKHRALNTHNITSVIRCLDKNKPMPKKAEKFKHPPLNIFWKAHYFDEHFMLKNIYNEWGIFKKKSRKFKQLITEVIREEEKEPSSLGCQGRLAHKFIIEGFENKSKKGLTGEWIIFSKVNNKNYYLSLSTHTKSEEEDKTLYQFIKQACEHEFPHVFEVA